MSSAPQGPERLGPYLLEAPIGRGAMGAVYRARDPRDGLALAIKTLALGHEFDGDALDEARLRFTREAQAAARLAHPDIVQVLASGEERGLAWIAMEFVPGRDLSHHTQAATLLPVPALLGIVARVADALAYAHRQGVVHRDIKPANVMVDLTSGSVKVTDFGIARIADATRTRTGMVLGTPSFMSPEQMLGRQVDGRSDLYSLGVTLFQLLCARLPHQADSMGALMGQIANEPAPDVRSLRPQLPEALADAVALMLEKRPELRYADGGQLAADLRLIAAGMADVEAGAETAPLPAAAAPPAAPFAATVKFSRGDPGHNPAE